MLKPIAFVSVLITLSSTACSGENSVSSSGTSGAGGVSAAGTTSIAGTGGAAAAAGSNGTGGSAVAVGGASTATGGGGASATAGGGGSGAGAGGAAAGTGGAAGGGSGGVIGAGGSVNSVPADYKGTPFTTLTIPGRINTCDYDRGGAGVAWCHDMGNCGAGTTTGDYPQASGVYRPLVPAGAKPCGGAACDDNVGVCRMNPQKPDNTIAGQPNARHRHVPLLQRAG